MFLSLDIGLKHIGVALGDPETKISFPHSTIANKPYRLQKIHTLIEEHHCTQIIIGLPLTFSGEETAMSQYIRRFSSALQDTTKIPIIFSDERLSSHTAHQKLQELRIPAHKAKGHKHSISAQIILHDYFHAK